jgi:hypothetical protein
MPTGLPADEGVVSPLTTLECLIDNSCARDLAGIASAMRSINATCLPDSTAASACTAADKVAALLGLSAPAGPGDIPSTAVWHADLLNAVARVKSSMDKPAERQKLRLMQVC